MKKQIEELIAKWESIKETASKIAEGASSQQVKTMSLESKFNSESFLIDLRTLLEPEQPKKRYFLVYYTKEGGVGLACYAISDGFVSEKSIKRDCGKNSIVTGIQELSEQDYLDWTRE